MSVRKLAAILLSIGYLTAVHCRGACAFSIPMSAAVEEHQSDCHHEADESNGHDSKAPCCATLGGEAMLPSAAPLIAPQTDLSLFVVVPPTGPAGMPLRFIASKQNHDPPGIVSEVRSLSSLGPRAPPAAFL